MRQTAGHYYSLYDSWVVGWNFSVDEAWEKEGKRECAEKGGEDRGVWCIHNPKSNIEEERVREVGFINKCENECGQGR